MTYRRALARFASGVTIVTTQVDGVDHAMTASAFTSVSLRPPLVLVCVERVARFHEAVLASGRWAVSVLPADAHDVATWLAMRGRALDGQLAGIAIRRGITGAALLADAIATLECRTWAVHDGGDHSIVVGEVVAAEPVNGLADLPADPAAWGGRSPSPAPLVYFAGGYRTVTEPAVPE
ncbi:flavin reductase family protein [Actinopolymorpha sp. B17G11]|uniref:flavin reductase family protein n=1 Tax=unclassified Actinopolymorpha TaxID=2627063 RepID=UPI0032D8F02D